MKKINDKILSIPPYISTSWKNIKMLHMKEAEKKPLLVIVLQSESVIEVPHLEKEMIEQIFETHSKFIEQEAEATTPSFKPFQPNSRSSDMAFSFGLNSGEEGANLGSILEHNSDQKNTPELPPEILSKVTTIAKTLGMDIDQMNIPKAEPHCNCVYCQVARALQNTPETSPEAQEEETVSDEDLRFRDWEIKQEGNNLYLVTNPLNQEEHYQVFLGSPVGCTCGQKNCEHIQFVLKS